VREAFHPSQGVFVSRESRVPLAGMELVQQLDWLAHVGRDPATGSPRLVAAPTAAATPWLVFGGSAPDYSVSGGSRAIANPPGMASDVFSPELFAISRAQRYRLSTSLQQEGSAATINYL